MTSQRAPRLRIHAALDAAAYTDASRFSRLFLLVRGCSGADAAQLALLGRRRALGGALAAGRFFALCGAGVGALDGTGAEKRLQAALRAPAVRFESLLTSNGKVL